MSNTAFTPGLMGRATSASAAFMQSGAASASSFAPTPPSGFPRKARDTSVQPRHFAPADPSAKPTEGWDPFAAGQTTGFSDPVVAAREAGFAEGHATALEEVALREEAQKHFETQLAEALATTDHFDRDRMAQYLRETVLQLVKKMVGEQGNDADLFAARIKASIDLLADSAEAAIIRMHPADLEAIEGRLPDNFTLTGDASLQPGAFVIESMSTIVEDGPDLWFEQLKAAIDRVPLPVTC